MRIERVSTAWFGAVVIAGVATLATTRCNWFTDSNPSSDPRVVWQYPFDTKGSYTAPLVLDSVVVFGTSAGFFVALDRRTGRLRWQRSVVPGEPIFAHVMATAGGRVLAPAFYVAALNLADGSEAWKFNAYPDDPGDESIAVAGSVALGTGPRDGYTRSMP
jgi:outer membrane protein assembly factor BamB